MTDETTGADAGTSSEPGVTEIPTDFREYERWRTTGELPAKPPSAAATAQQPAPAKIDPDSETEPQEPEEEESGETGETPEEGRKRSSSRNRRIDKLTREIADLKRQLEAQPPKAETAPAPATGGKPKLEQFQTLEAYQEALTDWKMDERERLQKARADVERVQTSWAEKEKATKQAHPDYDHLIDTVEAPNSPAVHAARQAMLEDDNGPEILYFLANNTDELQRIAALSPLGAVKEIGRLSALLPSSTASETSRPRITSAAKPPPAITRPARTSSGDIHDEDTARDFRKWSKIRTAQLKG